MLGSAPSESPAAGVDQDAPVGPSADEEEAFLAEQRAAAPRSTAVDAEPDTAGEMPPLEDLVKRIPLPARDLMEELFRARFVTVKRVPKSALKS